MNFFSDFSADFNFRDENQKHFNILRIISRKNKDTEMKIKNTSTYNDQNTISVY